MLVLSVDSFQQIVPIVASIRKASHLAYVKIIAFLTINSKSERHLWTFIHHL